MRRKFSKSLELMGVRTKIKRMNNDSPSLDQGRDRNPRTARNWPARGYGHIQHIHNRRSSWSIWAIKTRSEQGTIIKWSILQLWNKMSTSKCQRTQIGHNQRAPQEEMLMKLKMRVRTKSTRGEFDQTTGRKRCSKRAREMNLTWSTKTNQMVTLRWSILAPSTSQDRDKTSITHMKELKETIHRKYIEGP